MQVQDNRHLNLSKALKEQLEREKRCLDEDDKQFFKLFEESTFEGSRAVALEIRKIAKRQTKEDQELLLFHKMLSWPNSLLLVLLQFVDPNMVFGDEESSFITPLHHLADLADPFVYSTHENKLILAIQHIEHGHGANEHGHGANVNCLSSRQGDTLLHNACYAGNVTNLDFVELLLKSGADPNAQDKQGQTPLMYTTMLAPGAAKCLLNWPTTDVNITTQSGESFPIRVRSAITGFSVSVKTDHQVRHKFMIQQWREIEEMLVERRL
jgi:hypothetical protein